MKRASTGKPKAFRTSGGGAARHAVTSKVVWLRSNLVCRATANTGSEASIAMRDGSPPANAYCVARNNQRGWQLTTLEFVGRRLDAIKNFVDQIRIVSGDD